MLAELTLNSEHGRKMMGYLPGFYATSRIMTSVMDAQGDELDKLGSALDDILAQYFVSTASWGLEIWERELGIPVDQEKPVEQRRAVVLSKIRGIGTVTVSLIKSVAEAFDGGTVEVTAQPEQYRFTVKFIDTLGVPANLGDLLAAIEEIKPAHLAVKYEYKYLLIDQVQGMTLNEVQSHRLSDFAPFIPVI
ncbi:YmfQ family protein [Cohnella caldifontis]|uniref:YmfQ family protein n=1 Tax=Cohnella caldifontis TaxID=3027471 RepID=UPI0023EBE443|nr:YmfQ family protein [Cohnella sp. YIM B05605]